MGKVKTETPAVVPAAADEHEGMGGSYLVGEDGKRVLVERTLTQEEAAALADVLVKEK